MGNETLGKHIWLTQRAIAERDRARAERDALIEERDMLVNAIALLNVDLHERGILLPDPIREMMSSIIKKFIKPKNAETAIKEKGNNG